jgi:protein-tyrosine phosphatase
VWHRLGLLDMGTESILSGVAAKRQGRQSVRICWKTERTDPGISIHYAISPSLAVLRSSPAVRVRGTNQADIAGLDADRRYYFGVVPDGEEGIVVAERQVELEGAVNCRDLGGYETIDGRHIRWGQVFRSDSLARLTESDRVKVGELGLRLVIDFRTPNEVKKSPDRLPESGALSYLNLPIAHGEFDFVGAVERIKKGDDTWLTPGFMVAGYIQNVDDFPGIWGEVIRRLTQAENRPLLFHCTGGKDRAGTCAALILLALGVPEETVIADHQLSNVFIADLIQKVYERIASYGVDPQKLSPYFTAPRECIVSLLGHLRKAYGSPVGYLKRAAGLTEEILELLKEELLE